MGYIRSEADIEGERREHADPRGPSSTRNQHTSWNGGRQETIGHCLIRQWPIVLDAVMVGFWPFSLTVLTIFSSPSVSPLPPPLHSEVHPSAPPRHGGPRARPHPGASASASACGLQACLRLAGMPAGMAAGMPAGRPTSPDPEPQLQPSWRWKKRNAPPATPGAMLRAKGGPAE